MKKKQLILVVKLIISLALLAYMYTQIAPKWDESADLIKIALSNGVGYILGALAAFSVVNLVCVIRWKLLLDAQHVGFSVGLAFKLFCISLFFGQCVPGGITGGEVARIYYVTRLAGNRKQEAMAVTLLDRFCGMMGLAMILVVAAFFIEDPRLKKWCIYIICVSAAAMIAAGLFFSKRVASRIPYAQKLLSKLPYKEGLKRIYNAYNRFSHNKIRLITALLLAGVVHFFLVVTAWLSSKALGFEAGFQHHLILMPLVTALRSIPISPVGDIGTAEVAFIKIYSLLPAGYGASAGVFIALAFLMRAVYLLWAFFGWIVYIRFRSQAPGMSLKDISHKQQLVKAE